MNKEAQSKSTAKIKVIKQGKDQQKLVNFFKRPKDTSKANAIEDNEAKAVNKSDHLLD